MKTAQRQAKLSIMHHAGTLLARVAASVEERRRAEAAMARRFAPSFNALSLIGPGETQLSTVLRWMLDEHESHGQGAAFRDLFLSDVLYDDPIPWAGSRALTEVSTGDGLGRIDLLMISKDQTRSIIIENKPWAGWQTDQLLRYLSDQMSERAEVRVHALLGHPDVLSSLEAHWGASSEDPLPSNITASGFDEVVAWIERCASASRANRVREFLEDLADYCRKFILSEPSMEELNTTADLILAGGNDALAASRSIAAALPFALNRATASRLNVVEMIVGRDPTVRIEVDGIPVNFVLYGKPAPWAGVTDGSLSHHLVGEISWGRPERIWPRWAYLRKIGDAGRQLDEAARDANIEEVVRLVPLVARSMLSGPCPNAVA